MRRGRIGGRNATDVLPHSFTATGGGINFLANPIAFPKVGAKIAHQFGVFAGGEAVLDGLDATARGVFGAGFQAQKKISDEAGDRGVAQGGIDASLPIEIVIDRDGYVLHGGTIGRASGLRAYPSYFHCAQKAANYPQRLFIGENAASR